ncbi:hypothetical protein K458DRAFT_462501 [Lentithecium fluviatile CBS 122367]|uniref:Uncharacterized protein n=1 Tax=Lentithecium fluviatile CBS 122367 TaxID=1168545 RepID=A0A6G1JFY6_9PLEO|nr:hypothetical protein K458DRAFT_462501 [Lentithecium fluviatile CBS 122367]
MFRTVDARTLISPTWPYSQGSFLRYGLRDTKTGATVRDADARRLASDGLCGVWLDGRTSLRPTAGIDVGFGGLPVSWELEAHNVAAAAAAAGNGERKLDRERAVMLLAMPAAVPTSRVGLGRLEDQESADGARGGWGRAWWLQNINVIRVKIKLCSAGDRGARRTGVDPTQPWPDMAPAAARQHVVDWSTRAVQTEWESGDGCTSTHDMMARVGGDTSGTGLGRMEGRSRRAGVQVCRCPKWYVTKGGSRVGRASGLKKKSLAGLKSQRVVAARSRQLIVTGSLTRACHWPAALGCASCRLLHEGVNWSFISTRSGGWIARTDEACCLCVVPSARKQCTSSASLPEPHPPGLSHRRPPPPHRTAPNTPARARRLRLRDLLACTSSGPARPRLATWDEASARRPGPATPRSSGTPATPAGCQDHRGQRAPRARSIRPYPHPQGGRPSRPATSPAETASRTTPTRPHGEDSCSSTWGSASADAVLARPASR